MIRRILLALLLSAVLAPMAAQADRPTPDGLMLDASDSVQVTCAAGGTAITVEANANYVITVQGETAWVKRAATCGTGGHPVAPSSQLKLDSGVETTWCCRSAGGGATLTRTRNYPRK